MTGLTEQEVKDMSEMLGIPEEQLLSMSEDALLDALDKTIAEYREFVAFKKHEAVTLRTENVNLRCTNIWLKIQIGFLRTIRDIQAFLTNN